MASSEDTLHKPGQLFAARQNVYTKDVKGPFRTLKWSMLVFVLAVYYLTPWIRWDRGEGAPDQAVLIDMAGRKAYFFFIEIWPQDIYILTGLLVVAALTLFFVTSIAGRIWCAYACPQTVWTDLYMWIERKIEGDGPKRRKRDAGPFTLHRAALKTVKHAIWLLIAIATGGAWIFYFQDAPGVFPVLFTGEAGSTTYFFIGLFTCTTYLLGGWAREQVCTYMCPWPRFQAAMFDEDTLIVGYHEYRGEPRSRHAKRQAVSSAPAGDCIDCGLCVEVCPTGIDIRDGNQLECIGCGLCVDACNNVMAKLARPANLISHETDRNLRRLRQGQPRRYKLWRPRTIFYATLLAGLSVLMVFALIARAPIALDVIADRAPLYVTLSDGSVRNGYTLKLINKSHNTHMLDVKTLGLEGARVKTYNTIATRPDAVTTVHVFVMAPSSGPASQTYTLQVHDAATGLSVEEPAIFRRPGNL
ncbi:MAG: cytochrome c oxidase accessory protein CcoG [Alphaproteobacteria bacterium]